MFRHVIVTVALILFASTALAAEIGGRLGITGKAGALVPLQDGFISDTSGADPGLAAGGGLIFGIGRNWAAEVDVTRLMRSDVNISGSKIFEASFTDLALGLQYRFAPAGCLVPFLGGGADFIKGELKSTTGASYNLDWTVGGHVNLGFDYFVTQGIALSVEARGLAAFDGDVKSSGTKVGSYDPLSFIGTVGIRLFLPEHPFQ
jgi:outer membrane protein